MGVGLLVGVLSAAFIVFTSMAFGVALTLLLNQNFETGLSAGVSAVLIAFALAGGLIVPMC
jgi:hypothetical protein